MIHLYLDYMYVEQRIHWVLIMLNLYFEVYQRYKRQILISWYIVFLEKIQLTKYITDHQSSSTDSIIINLSSSLTFRTDEMCKQTKRKEN